MPYLWYLRFVIPCIGALLLGSPACYRWLGVYTTAFGNARGASDLLAAAGLEVEYRELFFGCASVVFGRKPGTEPGQKTT